MRTTLTLDDDMLEWARLIASRTRKPFKTVVNEALRMELTGLENGVRQRPCVTTPHAMDRRWWDEALSVRHPAAVQRARVQSNC